MTAGEQPAGPAPRRRRSKTVWPWVFGLLILVSLLLVLGFSLDWFDVDATDEPPGT